MFAALFLLALLVPLFRAANITIDIPTPSQCQQVPISWTSGCSPYDVFVVSANDPCSTALEDLGSLNATNATWTANLASGTEIELYVQDACDDEGWSGVITIANSSNTACLNSTTTGPTTTHYAASSSASTLSPVANAGTGSSSSAAFSTRPFSAAALLGSTALAAAAMTP